MSQNVWTGSELIKFKYVQTSQVVILTSGFSPRYDFFFLISLYINPEWGQPPLSDNTKRWLLTHTLQYMDAQGQSNIV